MKFQSIVFLSCVFISVYSCKKASSSHNAFEDSWSFTGLHSEITSVTVSTDGTDTGIDSTVSSYDSKNNVGTIKFDGSTGSAMSIGLGYTTDKTSLDFSFLDGKFQDSSSFSISDTIPPANSSRGYILVGQDSVRFTGASLINDPENTYVLPGARYVINGSEMTLTSILSKDSTETEGGLNFTMTELINVTIHLQKP